MEPHTRLIEYATKAEVDADAIERVATFHGFTRLSFWFGVHALTDAIGIMFMLSGYVGLGLLFVIVGTAIIVSAIVIVVTRSRRETQTTLPAGSGLEPTALGPAVTERHMPAAAA
jgi:hypothetical protein